MSLFADIERQARSLPSAERARLAELMLESLHETPLSELEAAWEREISERVAAYDRGDTRTYAAEDVFAEARHIAQ
jgi:putative addiction module component (TIGR02574 family)